MRFENEYGSCELNPFPHCKHIVVSNKAFIWPQYRGKGHGYRNHQLRLKRAKDMGYKVVICTVRSDNQPERRILQRAKWKMVHWTYSDSGKWVEIWVKDL